MKKMSQIKTIPLSHIIQESDQLIKKNQYRKAYRFLNKPFQEPKAYFHDQAQASFHIQIARRLTYICIKIISNYISKFQEKSHKIKIILVRAFKSLEGWLKFIINFENYQKDQILCNSQIKISSAKDLKLCFSPQRNSSLKKSFIHSQASQVQLEELDGSLLQLEMVEVEQPKIQKSNQWLQYQKFELLHNFQKIMELFYFYLKLKKDTALVPIVLERFLQFNGFVKAQDLIKTQKIIQITAETLLLIGNAYFEIGSMSQAIPFYYECLILAVTIGVYPLLDDKEKQKVWVEDKNFQNCLIQNLSLAIISLDQLSLANEYISHYETALNALSFSEFLCSFLYYLRIGRELTSYVLARHEYIFNHYSDHLYEQWELLKLTETIYGVNRGFSNSKIQFYEKKTLSEQFQEQIYKKMNYSNKNQFIVHQKQQSDERITASIDSSKQLFSPFQQKVRKLLKVESPPSSPKLSQYENNTTFQSTKLGVSKNNASMTDLVHFDIRPSSAFASLSVTQQRIYSPISQHSQKSVKVFKSKKKLKFKKITNEKTNYLTELIRMQNQNLSDKLGQEQIEKEAALDPYMTEEVKRELLKQKKSREQNQLHSLDQEMKMLIDEKMTTQLKLVNYDKAIQNCSRLYKSQKDLKKEIPLTRGILGFRKEYGNGVAIIPESVEEFHRHFEFNFMKYFDYITSNKESAQMKIQDTENFKNLRLVEQKMFSSGKLVIKEQVEINNTEIDEEIQEQQNIENQANKLLTDTVKKHKKTNDIVFYKRKEQLSEIYDDQKQKMKEAYMKKILETSDDQTQLKLNLALATKNFSQDGKQQNKDKQIFDTFEEMKHQRAQQIIILQKNKAQENIKNLLSLNELEKEKLMIDEVREQHIQKQNCKTKQPQMMDKPIFNLEEFGEMAASAKNQSRKSRAYFNVIKKNYLKPK